MSEESGRLLVVDDEPVAVENLEHVLRKAGYEVTSCQGGAEALRLIDAHAFDVVLTDLRMKEVDGMQVLRYCREHRPDTEVVVITGYATPESAVEAMQAGAFYYVAKPFRLGEVRQVVKEAVAKVCLKRENDALKEELESYRGRTRLVTENAHMRGLLEMARQVAATDCNILISGESGTGKELLARYIHNHSRRAAGPFLGINCGAFSADLLANELFGHHEGAFTGATRLKRGLIEMASGGTLLLDEITEMPQPMQVTVLRVIQERELLRVGGTEPVRVDVRYFATTNREPGRAVTDGLLRQDLYYRLNVVAFELPPLRERRDDIEPLTRYFLSKYGALNGKHVQDVAPEALAVLRDYGFPGNVRELENLVERAVALATGARMEAEHLPPHLRGGGFRVPDRATGGGYPTLQEQEQAYIEFILGETDGNRTAAANILGIDRVSLWRKLKRFGLDGEEKGKE